VRTRANGRSHHLQDASGVPQPSAEAMIDIVEGIRENVGGYISAVSKRRCSASERGTTSMTFTMV
jgi:hypothetical protein